MVPDGPLVTRIGSPLVPEPPLSPGSGVHIRGIEAVPVRAPLAREFRGSYYRMTHRATLVVRVLTDAGIVGVAYVGDEDAAARTPTRPRSIFFATAGSGWSPWPRWTPRSGTPSARWWASRCGDCGAAPATGSR
jgi:hypothetical protein